MAQDSSDQKQDDVSFLLIQPEANLGRHAESEAPLIEAESVLPDETVFVIEDSKPNLTIASAIFERLGFYVIPCKSGHEAKETLEALSAADRAKIKAFFCDYNMPGLDGLELLQIIRRDSALGVVPFVLCTADESRSLAQKAKALTANVFVAKPITFEKVINCCKTIFPGRKFPTQAEISSAPRKRVAG